MKEYVLFNFSKIVGIMKNEMLLKLAASGTPGTCKMNYFRNQKWA
jgi:hypothetical protein